jgi:hypothetical protein
MRAETLCGKGFEAASKWHQRLMRFHQSYFLMRF